MSLKKASFIRISYLTLALCAVFALAAVSANAAKYNKIEKQNIVIIGDRVVDIAYNLGVLPVGMSVRCSLWDLCGKIKTIAQPVGCPGCLSKGKTGNLTKLIKAQKIKRVIIEKSQPFCILQPEADPLNMVDYSKKLGMDVQYVDFSKGVVSAIEQTAALLGKEKAGKALCDKYEKDVAKLKKQTSGVKLGKRVVILNGVYQAATGKSFIQVEAPGGYSDKFILEPLGCQNVGAALVTPGRKSNKGCWTIRKLKKLADAKPDAIVITGDSTAVQKAWAAAMAENPGLSKTPVFSLPRYIDSSVVERPQIVAKWLWALR
jgi:ABC-type Fe3+-hydroxamate transport system substrate-binding protein